MKLVALAILAVFAIAMARPGRETSEEGEEAGTIQKYRGELKELINEFMKKTAEEICVDKNTDLKTPLEEMMKRAEQVDTESETMCSMMENHLIDVMEPLTTAIDRCLPNQEAGIARFAVESVTNVVSYICNSRGEHILELSNPCIDKIDLEKNKCIEDAQRKWNEITGEGKSFKEEVCREYHDVRPCIKSAVESQCKLQVTQDSIMGLTDSVFKTCGV